MSRHTIHPCPLLFAVLAIATLTLAHGCTSEYRDVTTTDDPIVTEETEEDRYLFSDLDFYGSWRWVEPFEWVWRPTVVLEWRPFVNGRWLLTEFGWTWISYEPFGWATCHYGFWAHDFALGWIWIPDYEWYPARVSWIVFDDFICWSPLTVEGYYWEEPWDRGDIDAWIVVPVEHFTESVVGRYHQRLRFRSRNTMTRTKPDPRILSEYSDRAIVPVQVELSQRGVGDRTIQQIVLPPDLQLEVDEFFADRERSLEEQNDDSEIPSVDHDSGAQDEPRGAKKKTKRDDSKKKPRNDGDGDEKRRDAEDTEGEERGDVKEEK